MTHIQKKTANYFSYEVLPNFPIQRVSLNSENINLLLERIESRDFISRVVPEISRIDLFHKFQLKYASFQQMDEVEVNGETFESKEGFRNFGKLLVPEHLVFTLDELAKRNLESEFFNKSFGDAFYKYLYAGTDVEKFFTLDFNEFHLLRDEEVLVLKKNQLL
jgi:hypothetical protein